MWVLTETCGENGMGGYGMLICWRQKRSGRQKGKQKGEERKEGTQEMETSSTEFFSKRFTYVSCPISDLSLGIKL